MSTARSPSFNSDETIGSIKPEPLSKDGAGESGLRGEVRPEFLRDELLHELFAETALMRPLQAAVKSGTGRLGYGELETRARRTARYLQSKGVKKGDRVVLWMRRSPEMYVALLAILEAGAAYVPLDPDFPADRVAFIATDCAARCILASADLGSTLREPAVPIFVFEDVARESAALSHGPLVRAHTGLTPEDAAYIIYTSGSTGRPKGVIITHRSICHFVRSEGSILNLRSDDLVFQGSSLSFDMSLEEIWPTWAAGATLLLGTKEMIRSGADLAPLLAREGVTVWTCVPTLLSMQETPIPSLRLLNLGGETCPPDLVRRWSRAGLTILNTYGPTETTITATYAEVKPDKPVTIGRPLPNYTAHIVTDDFKEAPRGDAGELWIGGPGVAQGYVGRPDLTADRFVRNPWSKNSDAVLYRTGDRARVTPDGEIEFHGRMDTQVKIRGFRVELAEIEACLVENPGISHAVVILQPGELLAAYVTLRAGVVFNPVHVAARLREKLPDYMVPTTYQVVAKFNTLSSGKIDRKALPAIERAASPAREPTAPETATERFIHARFRDVFGTVRISIDDDFFTDLGGHSVRAASLVSATRREESLRHISMGDVYQFPTVRKLASRLDACRPADKSRAKEEQHRPVPGWRYAACMVGQALGLVLVFGLFSFQWLIPYMAYAWLTSQEYERVTVIGVSLGLFVAANPAMLLVGIISKWLILGRLKPGAYPLWGLTYYRWWLTQRLLDTVPVHYLGGSPLMTVYYRLLGARIGRGVLLGSGTIDAPDCVEIGSDTYFDSEASLSCTRVEFGVLKVGKVRIGNECHIGTSSLVAMNASLEDRAELGDLSMLPSGKIIPSGEHWAGSPAAKIGAVSAGVTKRASTTRRCVFVGAYALLLFIFPIFAILPVFPGMALLTEIDQNTETYHWLLLSPILAILFVVMMGLEIAALKWILIGRVKPGRIPAYSFSYLRHWVVGQLMTLSLDLVKPLYATVYLRCWYRMLGVKVGARAEVSTASSIAYDLLEIGEESFIADGVSLGGPRLYRGMLTFDRTKIGKRAFVGNVAVIPSRTELGDGVLIGVLSIPPTDPAKALVRDSSWFGTPAVFLPQRQIASQFDEGSTFRPSNRLVRQRFLIEFIRVILPLTIVIALTSLMMAGVVALDDRDWTVTQIVLVFPFLYLLYGLTAAAFVVLLKRLVIGRYRATEKPLWNAFVWRSELVTSTYENLAVPFFVEMLRGTAFLPAYLRLLGCKIGKRVFMDTTDVTEFDVVSIGDDVSLNSESGPQTHLFEDRVMKISNVTIGDRCTLGGGAVVLYDTTMEAESSLGELSLLMKGETLPAGTQWEGSPAKPVY